MTLTQQEGGDSNFMEEDSNEHEEATAIEHVGDKINYASMDAGAVIMASSPGYKGPNNLLVKSKDKYALSPCSDTKKWIVVGLSEDILINEIRIANYEKYSSMVKDFQVLGSQRYPVQKWMLLGNFRADEKHGEQRFEFSQANWVRFIKLRFVSHYGVEFYCTLTGLKVSPMCIYIYYNTENKIILREIYIFF